MIKNQGREFEKYVADALREANIPFQEKVAMGGVELDFFLRAPNGMHLVAEAKSWKPKPINRKRAIQQAKLYKKVTGVDRAFIVMEDIKRGLPSEGLVNVKELIDFVLAQFQPKKKYKKRKPLITSKKKKTIFAAMPFSSEYEDVFFVAMAPAARYINAICDRLDLSEFVGDISNKMKIRIRKSIAVIADLSESNPNVLYEIGFAHALKLPIVHICSTPLDKLPFDVQNWNTIEYVKGQTHKLRDRLKRRLKSILQTT